MKKIMHYTIVEMMMVVAVFMIILSMAMFAWLNSEGSAKTRNAAREVSALLNLARAKAIAERTDVGVYFSTCGSSGSSSAAASSDSNPYYGKAAARIYYFNGTTRARDGYVDFEDWHALPGGVSFDFPSSIPTDNNLYNSDTQVQVRTAYIIFDRRGRVAAADNITVCSGGYSISVVAGSTQNNSITADSPYYLITVNPYTGRITTNFYEVNQ